MDGHADLHPVELFISLKFFVKMFNLKYFPIRGIVNVVLYLYQHVLFFILTLGNLSFFNQLMFSVSMIPGQNLMKTPSKFWHNG